MGVENLKIDKYETDRDTYSIQKKRLRIFTEINGYDP